MRCFICASVWPAFMIEGHLRQRGGLHRGHLAGDRAAVAGGASGQESRPQVRLRDHGGAVPGEGSIGTGVVEVIVRVDHVP
jgi:hypothetical protein